MKRIGLIAAALLVILLLVTVVLPSPDKRNAPKFVPGKIQPGGNYTAMHYDWSSPRPFVNDKVWIFGSRDGTNRFTYLYDLRERVILGELLNAGAILPNHDGTKLLVLGRNTRGTELKTRLLDFVRWISSGRIAVNDDRIESFWILNLKDNSSKRVGSVKHYAGSSSGWHSSPNLRYGCTIPTPLWEQGFVLFDFQDDSFTWIAVNGNFCGWWDDENVLLRDGDHNFLLYDVEKRRSTQLFSAEMMRQTLEQLNLPSNTTNVISFANWNGREYDFYFVERDYVAKHSFVLKADRTSPKPRLKQVFQSFKFEWGGRFDAKAEQFLYQGESGAPGRGGDGAVYLKDVTYNSIKTLMPPDNKGQYSIPRFYGDEVIYYRNRVLWRIGLDGSNNVPLFPTIDPPRR